MRFHRGNEGERLVEVALVRLALALALLQGGT